MTGVSLERVALLAVALLAVAPACQAQGIWGPQGDTDASPSPYQAGPGSPVAVYQSPTATPAPPSGPSAVAVLAKPGSGSGCWVGVTKDFRSEPLSTYLPRAGLAPAAYNLYVNLPLDQNSTSIMSTALPQIAAQGAIVLLTVEPIGGLANITYDAIGQLAYYIKQFQLGGGQVMVSFAQEMNGNWYPWGQQPSAFVAAFRKVHDTLQSGTCGIDMVWAPNAAVGYPWRSGNESGYGAAAGSQDFSLMDTNHDGVLTIQDDPYSPFYPGDQYVAWVGMSSYSWGGTGSAPYLNNILAGPDQFANAVTGAGTAINNLYGRFCQDGVHNKPMVITETSAFWLPSITEGVSDLQIKSTWWQQVFNAYGDTDMALDVSIHFPMIKMILWFDIIKPEGSANGQIVDWRFSGDATVASALVEYLGRGKPGWNASYWGTLPAFKAAKLGHTCPASSTSTKSEPAGRRLLTISDLS